MHADQHVLRAHRRSGDLPQREYAGGPYLCFLASTRLTSRPIIEVFRRWAHTFLRTAMISLVLALARQDLWRPRTPGGGLLSCGSHRR